MASWMRTLSKSVSSVRFYACPVSESSAAARCVKQRLPCTRIEHAAPPVSSSRPAARLPSRSTFFFAHYNQVKTISPNFGFQIRHADADPYMVIAYDFGETAKVPLAGLQASDIARKVRTGAFASAPLSPSHFSRACHTRHPPHPHSSSWSRPLPLARTCPAPSTRAGRRRRSSPFSPRS